MRPSTSRLFPLAAALSFGLVEACMLAAGSWTAPADEPRAALVAVAPSPADTGTSSRVGSPSGALLQIVRPRRSAAAPEPSTPIAAIERATPPAAPVAELAAPLPPPRPVELASLGYLEIIAPQPPARPREFAAPLAEATPLQQPAAQAPPFAVASLSSASDSSSPLPRREDGNFRLGAAAYVRIFKKEGELELWLKRDGRYALYKTYPICKWSGGLGPKLRSGDYQSPEGFYSVSARQLNPSSAYHRAFNIGFPNAFDRQNGRSGGALMVHGACKSVGCFAMTDKVIEEIYGAVEAALRGGQHDVPVHIFPFRMTEEALAKETRGDWTTLWAIPPEHQKWAAFWQNLKEGYDLFERTGEPPTAYACGARYGFEANGSCTRIAGW